MFTRCVADVVMEYSTISMIALTDPNTFYIAYTCPFGSEQLYIGHCTIMVYLKHCLHNY